MPLATVAILSLATACGSKDKNQEAAASSADSTEVAAEPVAEAPAAVIELAKGQSLDLTSGKPVVIDFNATWCGPCKMFAPTFEEVAAENAGKALFYSVDVDVHPELAAEYNATSIPLVVYIPADGANVTSKAGLQTKEEFAASVAELLK